MDLESSEYFKNDFELEDKNRMLPDYKERKKIESNQCEYNSYNQGDINRHIQSLHNGNKFACDQCDN